ncbi:MAG: ABC transporter ATP-binding protein [Vallitalea sp.]|jgi:ABC-2 type transport system ATP-binding protein|nr:ABC transporter ATP-binding protein [Vallitalea sp.]MCT4597712.1 ABC transporter ATP-binding protein [Vallitalea sp.]
MLEIKQLSKKYKKKKALININFTAEKGKVIGLLGSSGSGKTTLMNIIAGITPYKEGNVLIEGEEQSDSTKAIVSLLTENHNIPKWMKVQDIIDFYIQMYDDFNEDKFQSILHNINFTIPHSTKVTNMSKGMKQLLRIALSISREAKLYLLDEPLAGLDTMLRNQVIDILLSEINEESTVIISSHIISEVEKLLDEVIFIKDGEIKGIHNCEELRVQKGQSIEKTFIEVMKDEEFN